MNDEFINLRDQQVLYDIKDYLQKIAVESTIMEASKDLPYNLLVAITKELVSVNIMFVPLPEDHFVDTRLLQQYVLVVAEVSSEKKKDFLELLNEINNQSPIGSFSINERAELGFKYIYPVVRFGMVKEEAFIDIFSLYLNCLLNFKDTLIQVNSGALSVRDALNKVKAG